MAARLLRMSGGARDAIRAHQRVSSYYAADAGVAARSAGEDDPSMLLAQLGERAPPRFFLVW
ncbi:MAG: hypothetical protein CM15mP92_1380 [Halieaceae bacterium]|nr:MAG: hypothetical protein CM15mP92_1380 [Halieaceae bacterium]